MAKHSANGRSLDSSMKLTGFGTVYIFENDAFDNPLLTTTESLGYNNSMAITFNKETEDRDHTNFDVRVIEETVMTSMAPTADFNFSEFATSVIAKYLNSLVSKSVSETKTIEITVKKDNITQDKGFFYPIDDGIDTITVEFGTATVAVEGVHYVVQNGSVVFNSLARQTAAGATTLLDPSVTDVEVSMEVKTIGSDVVEFETVLNKSYGLYIELYSTFKGVEYLHQIRIHKVNAVLDTLPFKADDTEALSYDVTFNILASTAITDPTKSKYFSKRTIKLPTAA